MKLGFAVGLRALMHAVVGYVGAKLIKRGLSFTKALTITMPIHAILEAVVVIPFIGLNIYKICIVVAVGTALHHAVDSAIAVVFSGILKGTAKLPQFISSSKN
jgi:niacin transporter